MYKVEIKNNKINLHNSSITNLTYGNSINGEEFNKLREAVGWSNFQINRLWLILPIFMQKWQRQEKKYGRS